MSWWTIALAAAPGTVGILTLQPLAAVLGSGLGLVAGVAFLFFWPLGLALWLFAWTVAVSAVGAALRIKQDEIRAREIITALRRGDPEPH